jgi:hypothetical protein
LNLGERFPWASPDYITYHLNIYQVCLYMGVPVPEAPRKMSMDEYASWFGKPTWMLKRELARHGR